MSPRLVALVALTLLGLLSTGGIATAAPPTTTTVTQQGVVETFVDVVPSCEDPGPPLHTITTTSNRIEHETVFADGRVHVRFTDTGTFVAEPLDASLPSYTGRFTIAGGFNDNGKTSNGTFVFNVRGTASDGSRFTTHFVEHFNVRPDGSVREFFRCH